MKHHTLRPLYITLIALTGISIFTLWLISVVLPITFIELGYLYKHSLVSTLGITDIRGLVSPSFSFDTTGSGAVHTTDGIVIPAIFVDEPVIYNVNPNDSKQYLEALKHGIAHASGTAFPGTGKLGYYFAHSSTPAFASQLNAVFYLLYKLTLNDTVSIYHGGKRYDYSVYAKQIVDPKDTAFLRYTNPVETIVLQTCWPPGTTSERLLVFAKRK